MQFLLKDKFFFFLFFPRGIDRLVLSFKENQRGKCSQDNFKKEQQNVGLNYEDIIKCQYLRPCDICAWKDNLRNTHAYIIT